MKQPVEQFSLRALNGREIEISKFDQVPYQESYEAMASFAKLRSEQDHDQIWL